MFVQHGNGINKKTLEFERKREEILMFIRQEAIQIKELKNELKQCTDWIDFYQNNNDKNLISRMQKELDQVILKSKQARKQL